MECRPASEPQRVCGLPFLCLSRDNLHPPSSCCFFPTRLTRVLPLCPLMHTDFWFHSEHRGGEEVLAGELQKGRRIRSWYLCLVSFSSRKRARSERSQFIPPFQTPLLPAPWCYTNSCGFPIFCPHLCKESLRIILI